MKPANEKWIDRPDPRRADLPFEDKPKNQNPVLRGLPLHLLSQLVHSSTFVQQILYQNAGFAALRDKPEIQDAEPRYENVVVKIGEGTAAPTKLSAFLQEDWSSKSPSNKVYHSVFDYHEAFKSGRLTPLDVAETLLPFVRRDVPSPSKHASAFLESRVDLIRKAAAESTLRYKNGKPLSPLDGCPVTVKDESDVTGYRKCYGSKADFTNKTDATSYNVQQWLDAGAILIGKATMHELGMDTTNNNPIFGTPLNPHNERYYTGGSSGGSGYAVSAGLVPIAMGNDGGGSIRLPASYCGIFGLKPTQGRVSVRPTKNDAKSTAVSGPMAANMLDLELAWRILAQPDPLDSTSCLFSAPQAVSPFSATTKKRILGIYQPWFDRADPVVRDLCHSALTYLTTHQNYTLQEITLPLTHSGQTAHALTILSEVIAILPPKTRSTLTAPNRILLSIGARATAQDFLLAQKLRRLQMGHLAALWDAFPGMVIVTPTTPNAGWAFDPADLAYGCSDGNMQIRNMEYVWAANFHGCPAITCPVGYAEPKLGTAEGRVPVGLMGMGEWCDEEGLIELGYHVERYLEEEYEGGRVKPKNFVDVLELVKSG